MPKEMQRKKSWAYFLAKLGLILKRLATLMSKQLKRPRKRYAKNINT